MNKTSILLIAFILFVGCRYVVGQDDNFKYPEKADYPEISKSGKSINDFIPAN